MRIAYVINSVEGGGAALPVPSIAGVLRRAGAEVKVFALTRRDGRATAPIQAAGFATAVRDGGEADHRAALRWLDHEVSEWRATHLWTSLTRATLLGQLVGLRRRIPVVSWQHAAYLKPANRRLLRATQRLSRLWIGDSERITQLSAERLGIPRSRLVTWPIFRADPEAPIAADWRPGETLRIGSLGRLHRVKGYDVLIDALTRLPVPQTPYAITIGGEGSEGAALQAASCDARVPGLDFAGYIDSPKAFLARLHLYVQPSRSEGFCVAAHEAMQAGLPVIGSAVGEMPTTIVDGVTGWSVPAGDAGALTAAIEVALRSPERLASMGAAARARVLERFGPERFEATGRAIVARMAAF